MRFQTQLLAIALGATLSGCAYITEPDPDAYPLSEAQLNPLRSMDGDQLSAEPARCGDPIDSKYVKVVDTDSVDDLVRNASDVSDGTQFSIKEPILVRSNYPGMQKNRDFVRLLSANLGCDLVMVADTMAIPGTASPFGSGWNSYRYMPALWGVSGL